MKVCPVALAALLLFPASAAVAAFFPPMDIEPALLVPETREAPPPEAVTAPEAGPGKKIRFLLRKTAKVDFDETVRKVVLSAGRLAICGDTRIKIVDAKTQKPVASYVVPEPITAFAFDSRGARVAAGGDSGQIYVYEDGVLKATYKNQRNRKAVTALGFNAGGSTLAAGYKDGHIEVWDANFGEVQMVLDGHDDRVNALAIQPDETTMISSGDDMVVKVWDLSRKRETRSTKIDADELFLTAFSRDGGALALGIKTITVARGVRTDERFLLIQDTQTAEETRRFKLPQDISAAAFNPNKRYIATASEDRAVKIWDIGEGEEAYSLDADADPSSLAFSADGKLFAYSAGADVTVFAQQGR